MTGARRPGRRSGRAPEPPDVGAAAVDAEPDPEQLARSIALRLLTAAPRSRQQLAEAMARRDVPEAVTERVLDRFTDVGLVDDAGYAEGLVRAKHESRGLARRALAVELKRKGVGDEDARAALAQIDDADEEAAARELLARRWRRDLDPVVQSRRLLAMLGRKGYSPGMAARLVREMVDDSRAQSSDQPGSDLD
ncbi:regulatory protein RecX [Isoptericola sp. b441]|uniref:Regulatory protein RecX n=1 Tax=Actinotalea lenta TaxID=3064654 RepID=A0ABT9D912_9CELL|nr:MULTISPECIES: regulatory protein RecX [unclassified Isoptericola]MDO8107390.1 regulatory protein RecX [Isoptericola sp. b441]MDO8120947.1 regulatory protein RecX [Isoptericola sp. b490]